MKIKFDIKNLVNKTELKNVEDKIPDTKNLASKSELTAVENKIPADVSSLVKKKLNMLKILQKLRIIMSLMQLLLAESMV